MSQVHRPIRGRYKLQIKAHVNKVHLDNIGLVSVCHDYVHSLLFYLTSSLY